MSFYTGDTYLLLEWDAHSNANVNTFILQLSPLIVQLYAATHPIEVLIQGMARMSCWHIDQYVGWRDELLPYFLLRLRNLYPQKQWDSCPRVARILSGWKDGTFGSTPAFQSESRGLKFWLWQFWQKAISKLPNSYTLGSGIKA